MGRFTFQQTKKLRGQKAAGYLEHSGSHKPLGAIKSADAFGTSMSKASLPFAPGTGAILDILFPATGQLRSRKVVTRSRRRCTGLFPSLKTGRMMQYESVNERNVFVHLEVQPEVLDYGEQPCKLVYADRGAQRVHYPDILVLFAGRKEFWEVKSRNEATDPEVVRRTSLLQHLNDLGYGYKVVIAEDFKTEPRLRNAGKLLRFGSIELSPTERERVRLGLEQCSAATWADACSGMFGPRSREALCRLVLEGLVSLDLDSPWTAHTIFESKGGH
jgi:hypothetical protein